MRRLVVLLLFVTACGSKSKPAATAGSGSQAIYAKKTSVGWGISGGEVFLQLTDETGKQTSYPLGTYTPECKVITPKPEMKAVTGVACQGVELDAVVSGEQVIVLTGDGTDPRAREEIQRAAAPGGAAVVVGQ